MGVQLKKVKVTSYIAQYPFLRKMCQLIKYHPAICAVRLHLVHRESYLTTSLLGGDVISQCSNSERSLLSSLARILDIWSQNTLKLLYTRVTGAGLERFYGGTTIFLNTQDSVLYMEETFT